ncbi:conserved hypothetical protein [Vibrio chagasii]|nr:conserved hypothetical protein [Vibrio chagasii]CAH6952458.1 conserved hypothetical protein [Vibrio chagasii]
MKDLGSTDESQLIEKQVSVDTGSASKPQKKKKLEMSKGGKMLFKISSVAGCSIALILLAQTILGGATEDRNTDSQKEETNVGSIPISSKEVSEEHESSIQNQQETDKENAISNHDTFVEAGVFDITEFTPSLSPIDNAPTLNGAAANIEEPTTVEEPVVDVLKDADDGGKVSVSNNKFTNKNRNGSRSNSTGNNNSEIRSAAITTYMNELLKPIPKSDGRSDGETTSRFKSVNLAMDNYTSNSPSAQQDGSGRSLDMDYGTQQYDENSESYDSSSLQSQSEIQSTGNGRGLRVGDYMLGKVLNGLHSSTPSRFMMVEILTPPLQGAIIPYIPELKYDKYVFSGDSVRHNGNQGGLQTVVVTPNENLSTGYRSNVDYHTFYRVTMMLAAGFASGAKTYVETLGGEVSISNDSTVVEAKEFKWEEALAVGAGSVVEEGQEIIREEISTPPTVDVASGDLIGIMVIDDFNPSWFPYIPKSQQYLNHY